MYSGVATPLVESVYKLACVPLMVFRRTVMLEFGGKEPETPIAAFEPNDVSETRHTNGTRAEPLVLRGQAADDVTPRMMMAPAESTDPFSNVISTRTAIGSASAAAAA